MANPPRQRTPEEIAKSQEIAKNIMQNQKKKDGLDSIKDGRKYILVAALYYVVYALLMYYYGIMDDVYLYVGLTVFYILLSAFYNRSPFVFSVIAFSFFILVIVIHAIINPMTLFGGWLLFAIKLTAIIGMVKAMVNSLKYKRELAASNNTKESEILDDGLIESN